MKYIFENLILGYESVYEICSCYDRRLGVFHCWSHGRTVTANRNCAVTLPHNACVCPIVVYGSTL